MKLSKSTSVSVIIPVYNEKKAVFDLYQALIAELLRSRLSSEIIFIDDNSTDGTYEYLTSFIDPRFCTVVRKIGRRGKAFSLVQGFTLARGDVLVMIDADMQYPPSAIPEMLKKLNEADIVIADRKQFNAGNFRKLLSKSFRHGFGKLLFGLSADVQSGMKVFKREVWDTIRFIPSSGWTFDLEFLHKARFAGFRMKNHEIVFGSRRHDASKVSFLRQSLEIGVNALKVRFKKIPPFTLPPKTNGSMHGAGVAYNRKQYVTHTVLPHHVSALQTFSLKQKLFLTLFLASLTSGVYANPLLTLKLIITVMSVIYFIDVVFNFVINMRSLKKPQELAATDEEIAGLDDATLPVYTILCPLYKEAHIIPQFVKAMSKISWPKDRLEVMLLLEEDDRETISAVQNMSLPPFIRTVIVPDSQPKTKPKACNYGLSLATGEYVVIFDAEDIPDPLQLKKAYIGFQKAPTDVICLQAKLNYYNPTQNLLTRLFTAEYSLWFDVTLTGLQSVRTTIPLGGTSNHFRKDALMAVHGWDPFNVTEDADLGIRLFKEGYKTAIIDSTTLEEANSKVKNWLRQRSRWLKGYMQTYLVHMRNPLQFIKTHGWHAFVFQLTVGGKIAFTVINPVLWVVTFSYFAFYDRVGTIVESFYLTPVFYLAVVSMIFGNFLFLYYYMLGCAKRGQWGLIKYVLFIPVYWVLLSIASVIALYQLLFKPHYWEKTVHGLHLLPKRRPSFIAIASGLRLPVPSHPSLSRLRGMHVGAAVLVIAIGLSNVLDYGFNAYIVRVFGTEQLSYIALIGVLAGLVSLLQIPFSALNITVNHRSGFLNGKYGPDVAYQFWAYIRKRAWIVSIVLSLSWFALVPLLTRYLHLPDLYPLLSLLPVFLIGLMAAADEGYLFSRMMFGSVSLVFISLPLVKLLTTVALVMSGYASYVYAAIPVAYTAVFLLGFGLVRRSVKKLKKQRQISLVKRLPLRFFIISLMSGLSTIAFMSLDMLLVKHYLSASAAGTYALISLSGKIIFFLGALSTQFIVPVVSKNEGKSKSSTHVLYTILGLNTLSAFIGYLAIGVFGSYTLPVLFGEKALGIAGYLTEFGLGMLFFSIATVFVTYYLSKRIYTFPIVAFFLSVLPYMLISMSHESIGDVVRAMFISGGVSLAVMTLLHLNITFVKSLENNLSDLFELLFAKPRIRKQNGLLNILIFNWRDTRHVWAGGAEVYVHEIARQFVKDGHSVTVFSGNDNKSPRNQVIDGVRVVRRGGTYTVYLWAFLYYVLRFRGKFDAIIDNENGIPFFTPLYVRKPVILLIHHVHQDVFKAYLPFPFSYVAAFVEAKVMPLLYRASTVVTVSASSKREIVRLGIAKAQNVHIIHPGIDLKRYKTGRKAEYPLVTYLGRLKAYKNIDVAVRAFAKIMHRIPSAKLLIIGEGEARKGLEKLVSLLKIKHAVSFTGKVSEEEKNQFLSKSWVVLQPSMKEGWGLTVLEANASGTPVIASRVPGLKDSVMDGTTGVLVPARSVTELQKALQTVLRNDAVRSHLSKNALIWSRTFTWDGAARTFLSLITESISAVQLRRRFAEAVFLRRGAYEK